MTTNKVNGKRYIGQHKSNVFDESYKGSGKVLKQALNKYGVENFETILLKEAYSKEELDNLEKEFILNFDALNSSDFYNIHEGGTGGNTKLGYSFKEYQEFLDKTQNRTSTFKQKDTYGEKNPMYGKHQSELSKLKRRVKAKRDNIDKYDMNRVYKDMVLQADSDTLKSAFSNNNGANNPSAVTYRLTNIDTGEVINLGSKSMLSKFLGISVKQASSAIKNKYYKPYNITILGKTKEVSYVSSYSIRRLDNIIRYNNRLKVHTQTVASHSYYVAYSMMRLLEIVDLPIEIKYKLLCYCLIHDISEIHTGDLPHDVKAANPELKEMVEKFEKDFYIQSGMYDIINSINDDYQKIKYNLFKLCDLMDVFMYAKEELFLGNNTLEMSNILTQSVEDCNTIVKALKFYKVLPSNFNFIKFLDDTYETKIINVIDDKSYKYTTNEMEEEM
jgi:group I intron endonuclease